MKIVLPTFHIYLRTCKKITILDFTHVLNWPLCCLIICFIFVSNVKFKFYFGLFYLKKVAKLMELDTTSNTTLWRDVVLVEVNIAVLYSFQVCKSYFVKICLCTISMYYAIFIDYIVCPHSLRFND